MGEWQTVLHQWLSAAWRRRRLILLPIAVMPLLALLIFALAPKQYLSHTSMLVQETAKLNPFLQDLAVSSNLEGRLEGLKTLLKSRHILSRVANEMGLMTPQDPPAHRDAVIAELSQALSLRLAGRDLIRIEYRANDPKAMAQLLTVVSERFIDQLLAPERSSLADSETFLRTHLERSREALELAEERLATYRSDNAVGLPELHGANFDRLSQIQQRLVERKAALAGARESFGSLDLQLAGADPVLARLEQEWAQKSAELATLLSRYTEQHSKVQAVQRVLRRLEWEREQALGARGESDDGANADGSYRASNVTQGQRVVLQRSSAKVRALEEEVRQLEQMAQTLEQQIRGVGEQERQLRSLQRDLKVKRALYEDLLTRYEMAQVTGALGVFEQSERIKVIDRPYTPSKPQNAPWWLYLLAGVVAGAALGAGLAVLAEALDPALRTAAEMEQATGLPVLGRVDLPLQLQLEE
ncbi:hypothetical protein [Ferrimonas marina]|uniref:Polysaccharide chain length determinant protein, PEP-CTERM locus subfamily n=1 Tax=Ferrimonas marina TaxID=299255 RepID=A0A1M5RTF4_9GAMM|nr:hypothetical protein [Ferrimonas marina]SHH29577.1 polysaccharide chain length determinant protein, PEP-CTERM locus subfamily [Ferrimonas marina]